jgi:hypothetical protein
MHRLRREVVLIHGFLFFVLVLIFVVGFFRGGASSEAFSFDTSFLGGDFIL